MTEYPTAATTPAFAIALTELVSEISYAQDEEVPALAGLVQLCENFLIVLRRVMPQHINGARGEIKRMLGPLETICQPCVATWGGKASDEENACWQDELQGMSSSPAIVTDPAQPAQPAVEPEAPVPEQEMIAEPSSEPATC